MIVGKRGKGEWIEMGQMKTDFTASMHKEWNQNLTRRRDPNTQAHKGRWCNCSHDRWVWRGAWSHLHLKHRWKHKWGCKALQVDSLFLKHPTAWWGFSSEPVIQSALFTRRGWEETFMLFTPTHFPSRVTLLWRWSDSYRQVNKFAGFS